MKIKKISLLLCLTISLATVSACGNKVDSASEIVTSEAKESESAETSASALETDESENSAEESNSTSDNEAVEEKEAIADEKTEETKPAIVDKTWTYNVDVSWIDTEKPMVALSFDDGPVYATGENSTAIRIQNALADNGMHATFFYWGSTLNGITQKEIERAYELGFELGNHTKTHADLSKLLTSEEIEKEVSYMDKKLSEIADQEYFLVRPPYLGVNQRVKDTLMAPLITCGLDTKDWNNATAQEIIDTIVEAAEKGTLDGQIVLMHETYTTTAEAVEYLVPYLKEAGYQVVSISEMFCARGKTMAGGKVFTSCSK